MVEKEATDEAPFSRNYSLNPLMNFEMTLVSYRPHVAKLLRINISKFGCALQARFTTFIYRNVALALLELRQCT